jgi:orotidine-5'-phosphate decarboxylase
MAEPKRNFMEMLRARWAQGKFVCVGLDSEYKKIPGASKERASIHEMIFWFNRCIVDNTCDLVCAYKPNIAFYENLGPLGIQALKSTVEFIYANAPGVPVILDAKRADIGNTNNGYVQMAFEYFGADAITVHPYLGQEALKPFLEMKDKGIIVLCRTSNPGAGEFQDLRVLVDKGMNMHSVALYEAVAKNVAENWNNNGNCALVVGATYPQELSGVRKIVGDLPILIPGIGAQGGDLEKTVLAGKDSKGMGIIINSSRGIIFASQGPDFAEAARRETQKLHDAITQCLLKGGF